METRQIATERATFGESTCPYCFACSSSRGRRRRPPGRRSAPRAAQRSSSGTKRACDRGIARPPLRRSAAGAPAFPVWPGSPMTPARPPGRTQAPRHSTRARQAEFLIDRLLTRRPPVTRYVTAIPVSSPTASHAPATSGSLRLRRCLADAFSFSWSKSPRWPFPQPGAPALVLLRRPFPLAGIRTQSSCAYSQPWLPGVWCARSSLMGAAGVPPHHATSRGDLCGSSSVPGHQRVDLGRQRRNGLLLLATPW